MNLEEMLKTIEDAGFDWSISTADNGYHIHVCRPEWVTNNLYGAVPLPHCKGNTITQTVESMINLLGSRNG